MSGGIGRSYDDADVDKDDTGSDTCADVHISDRGWVYDVDVDDGGGGHDNDVYRGYGWAECAKCNCDVSGMALLLFLLILAGARLGSHWEWHLRCN